MDDISSSEESTPAVGTARRRFDDEEGQDEEVLDSWDAAEDSEVEREKANKAAEANEKAEAVAASNRKSKAQRIAERQAERSQGKSGGDDESSDEEETASEKRERLRRTEQEADLKHAEDLFSGIGISNNRKAVTAGAVIVDAKDPNNTVDLTSLSLFNPSTKSQFEQLRNVLGPLLSEQSRKPHYVLFLQEFTKQLAKELSSEQIKKLASSLTALSNEKMKEEKAAEKGGKKTKAAKTKTTLVGVTRTGPAIDMSTYDDNNDFGEDDFM